MIEAALIREADDPIADARISLGQPKGLDSHFYLVFRGTPETVVNLLRMALAVAEQALPAGNYKDCR